MITTRTTPTALRPPPKLKVGDFVKVSGPSDNSPYIGYGYLGEVVRVEDDPFALNRYVVRASHTIRGNIIPGMTYYAHEDDTGPFTQSDAAAILAK